MNHPPPTAAAPNAHQTPGRAARAGGPRGDRRWGGTFLGTGDRGGETPPPPDANAPARAETPGPRTEYRPKVEHAEFGGFRRGHLLFPEEACPRPAPCRRFGKSAESAGQRPGRPCESLASGGGPPPGLHPRLERERRPRWRGGVVPGEPSRTRGVGELRPSPLRGLLARSSLGQQGKNRWGAARGRRAPPRGAGQRSGARRGETPPVRSRPGPACVEALGG